MGIDEGHALCNYVERNAGEPITTRPSMGKSLWIDFCLLLPAFPWAAFLAILSSMVRFSSEKIVAIYFKSQSKMFRNYRRQIRLGES